MWPIEKLRAVLIERVRAPFEVTRKRIQYACGEDDEFYTDIDVQHPVDGFVLAVVHGGDDRTEEFFRRVLHYRIPEVWLVDPEDRYVIRSRRGHEPERLTRDGVLVSAQLPSIRIELAAILG